MKNLLVVVVIIVAALGSATYLNAGCCAIPSKDAVATADAASKASVTAKVVTLNIEGMTCGSCEIAVKRVLTKVSGVKSATVSFEKKNAVVTYDAQKVSPEQIAGAVAKALPTYKAKVATK